MSQEKALRYRGCPICQGHPVTALTHPLTHPLLRSEAVRRAQREKANALERDAMKHFLDHETLKLLGVGEDGEISKRSYEEGTFKQICRAVLPHISLYVGSIVFILAGAHIFILLERPFQNQQRWNQTLEIIDNETNLLDLLWGNRTSLDYSKIGQATEQSRAGSRTNLNNPAVDLRQILDVEFHEFSDHLFSIHRYGLLRPYHIAQNMSGNYWVDRINDFGFVVFFILSMTSTIGYGEMQPFTWQGKLFCLIYGAIGFPLILITVADMAKFVSHFLTNTYTRYLTWKAQTLERMQTRYFQADHRRISVVPRPSGDEALDEEYMAEYLWENLDKVQYVQLPTTFVFGLIIAYCGFGALIFPQMEPWDALQSLYFSVISVMKIGFGDLFPANSAPRSQLIAILYILAGMILATSVIDTVGVTYLMRLHYLGRKMGETDYLAMMKRRKYRRRRETAMYEMVGLLTFLRNMRIPTQDEMPWTPDPPQSLVCTSVTATTISLRWEPPENSIGQNITYTLRCKAQRPWIKGPLRSKTHRRKWRSNSHYNMQPMEIKGIATTSYTLRYLQSFTIYEITLYAVNIWGVSSRTRLLQLTEPETAPQNIRTEAHDDQRVRVLWDTPIKKKNDIKRYTIYYTDDLDAPYEQWRKRYTDRQTRSISFDSLEENTTYAFSIAANYVSGHSPISRSLFVAVGYGQGAERFREVTRSSGNTIAEDMAAEESTDDTTEDSEIMIISTRSAPPNS